MKKMTSLAVSVAFLVASISFGQEAPKANPFKEVLASVPAAEMPAKAADLVLHAKSRDRTATATDVVKAGVGINPAAAPVIVSTIAKAVPEMASVAAGVAAAEQPKQAAAIAKAAAAAAPSQARKIVLAVCRAVPNDYRNIAVAVSHVASKANKDIVNAVATAVPGLRPYIDQAIAAYGGNVSSVSAVLDQASRLAQTTTGASPVRTAVAGSSAGSGATVGQPATVGMPVPLARGPAVGPPYIPLSTTPTNVTPGTSGEVPTGGRNYAAP